MCTYNICWSLHNLMPTWSLIAGKPPSPSSSYSSSPLLKIRHHHHHHNLVQVFRIKLPSGARERGRLIHRRDINQVLIMSWQCLDDDDDDNKHDDNDDDHDDHDPENIRWIMDTWASTVSGETWLYYFVRSSLLNQLKGESN